MTDRFNNYQTLARYAPEYEEPRPVYERVVVYDVTDTDIFGDGIAKMKIMVRYNKYSDGSFGLLESLVLEVTPDGDSIPTDIEVISTNLRDHLQSNEESPYWGLIEIGGKGMVL